MLDPLKKRRFKSVASDYLLTFAGSLVSVGILQLFVYPYLAHRLGNENYGLFLTIIAIVNALMPTFGSTLRNAHIVLYAEYKTRGYDFSDFKRVLLCVAPIVALLSALSFALIFQMDIFWSVLAGLLILSGVIKAYALVAFRLPVNPKKMFYVSLLSGVGYLVGLPLLNFGDCWVVPFLFSEILGLVYILKSSHVLRCTMSTTPLFGTTKKTYTVLILSNLVNYCVTYIDRFLLYPLFGPVAVSVYYAASFIGKACTFFVAPFSTVLLSYISDGHVAVSFRRYNLLNVGIVIFAAITFIVIAFAAPWVTSILYPSLVESALPYMFIGNAASLLFVANGINLTIVLKVAPAQWQLWISVIKLIVYVVAILISFLLNDLLFFCVGMLCSGFLVFAFTYAVGAYYLLLSKTIDV